MKSSKVEELKDRSYLNSIPRKTCSILWRNCQITDKITGFTWLKYADACHTHKNQ